MARSALIILIGLAILLASAIGADDAIAQSVRVGKHDGFRRLVVQWPGRVEVTWRKSAGEGLVIESAEPMPRDLEQRMRTLDQVVRETRLDGGRRSLTIAPMDGVTLDPMMVEGDKLVVDFHRRGVVPTIGVRIGKHASFERIVLEPLAPGSVDVVRSEGRVLLRLPRPLASGGLERIREAVEGVRGAESDGEDLRLETRQGIEVEAEYIDGDKLVLDLRAASGADRGAADDTRPSRGGGEKASQGEARSPPSDRGSGGGTISAVTSAIEEKGSISISQGGKDVPPRALSDPPIPLARPLIGRPVHSADREVAEGTRSQSSGSPHADEPSLDDFRLAPVAETLEPLEVESLAVLAAPHEDGLELEFVWPSVVPAAAFLRGGHLWVAFFANAQQVAADRANMQRHAHGLIRSIRREPHEQATIFRLAVDPGVAVRMERDEGTWRVVLSEAPYAPREVTVAAYSRSALLVPSADAAIFAVDPIIGDRIAIVFHDEPGMGVGEPRQLIDLAIQPSAQGLALRDLTGDLELERHEEGVLISRPEGLRLGALADLEYRPVPAEPLSVESPNTTTEPEAPDEELVAGQEQSPNIVESALEIGEGSESAAENHEQEAEIAALVDPTRLLDIAGQGVLRAEDLSAFRMQLLRDAAADQVNGGIEPLLRLARAHLGLALGAEALAFVQLARDRKASTNADAENTGDTVTAALDGLEGAASLIAGRMDTARSKLGLAELDADSEITLWRHVLDARTGSRDAGEVDDLALKELIERYPDVLGTELGLDLVELYLERGLADPAFTLLDEIERRPRDDRSEARFRLVQGRAFARDGEPVRALNAWQQGRMVSRSPMSELLTAEIVGTEYELGRIDVETAIEAIESQRTLWRGLPHEHVMLRRLGHLYTDAGRAEDALAIWRLASERAGDGKASDLIREDMSVLYADIIAARDGWTRTPLQALHIYRRHRELLPSGPAGDILVSGLADELAQSGLHSVGAALLDRRLAFRPGEKDDRERTMLVMASMHLEGGDYERCIELLDAVSPSTPERAGEHARMRAQAWAALGRDPELSSTEPLWAERLALDTAFANGDWRELGRLAKRRLEQAPPGGSLTGDDALATVRLASALAELGDRESLEALRENYRDRLVDPADRSLLDLLAGRLTGEGQLLLREEVDATRDGLERLLAENREP